MGVVTTYVCDVSGVSGDKRDDFVDVRITPTAYGWNQHRTFGTPYITIHTDVAKRLGLLSHDNKQEEEGLPPVPTLEEKLTTLLKEFISDVAQDVVENQ